MKKFIIEIDCLNSVDSQAIRMAMRSVFFWSSIVLLDIKKVGETTKDERGINDE